MDEKIIHLIRLANKADLGGRALDMLKESDQELFNQAMDLFLNGLSLTSK